MIKEASEALNWPATTQTTAGTIHTQRSKTYRSKKKLRNVSGSATMVSFSTAVNLEP